MTLYWSKILARSRTLDFVHYLFTPGQKITQINANKTTIIKKNRIFIYLLPNI